MAGGKEGPLATVIKSHPDCPGIFLCLLLFNSCSLEVSWDVLLTVLTAPPHGQWLCCDSCHCSWVSHILWVFQDFPLHFSQENASQSSVVGWVDASIKRKIIFKEGFILHVASALVFLLRQFLPLGGAFSLRQLSPLSSTAEIEASCQEGAWHWHQTVWFAKASTTFEDWLPERLRACSEGGKKEIIFV